MAYLISYTPAFHHKNFNLMYKIRTFQSWAILNDNTFIVDDKRKSLQHVYEILLPSCDTRDILMVFNVMRPAAIGAATSLELVNWLSSHLLKYDEKTHKVTEDIKSHPTIVHTSRNVHG